jgi:hypothetical protein
VKHDVAALQVSYDLLTASFRVSASLCQYSIACFACCPLSRPPLSRRQHCAGVSTQQDQTLQLISPHRRSFYNEAKKIQTLPLSPIICVCELRNVQVNVGSDQTSGSSCYRRLPLRPLCLFSLQCVLLGTVHCVYRCESLLRPI